uniref:C-type lectin domain-containing protein n=1 Tax=Oryzias melastigma TaxID=30732 RepID=A0A3B3DJC1_ORYME
MLLVLTCLWRLDGGCDGGKENGRFGGGVSALDSYGELYGWISKGGSTPSRFFCLNLIVVQEEKTWEEALDHCRENHIDFTSLLSQTENILAKNQIQNSTITQRVWVGLRFLGDTWMWANGDPLEFQVWDQTADPDLKNPVWKRCGALTKQGEWENRDCEEKLHFICI